MVCTGRCEWRGWSVCRWGVWVEGGWREGGVCVGGECGWREGESVISCVAQVGVSGEGGVCVGGDCGWREDGERVGYRWGVWVERGRSVCR